MEKNEKIPESYWTLVPSGTGCNYYKCGNCFTICDFPKKYCPACSAENKLVIVSEVK